VNRIELESLFRFFDLTGSGWIDAREFKQGLVALFRTLGKAAEPAYVNRIVRFVLQRSEEQKKQQQEQQQKTVFGQQQKQQQKPVWHMTSSDDEDEVVVTETKTAVVGGKHAGKINYTLFFRSFQVASPDLIRPRLTRTTSSEQQRKKALWMTQQHQTHPIARLDSLDDVKLAMECPMPPVNSPLFKRAYTQPNIQHH
jgi:hypothetical protein